MQTHSAPGRRAALAMPLLAPVLVTLLAAASASPAAVAAPLADVLSRPALAVKRPAQATLLGAAQAGGQVVAVGERGVIVVSSDGGQQWQQAQVPVSVTLTAVRLVDAKVGFAVGHGGVVLATDDGGRTWRKSVDGVQLAQVALKAAQAGADPVALKEAERLVADGADKPLLDLHFFDARRGLVVGAYNLAFVTEDGGASWQSVAGRFDNPKALHLYSLRGQGDTLLVAGEQGLVFRSDDAGRSFKRLSTPYNGSFFTAELVDAQTLIVAGLRGNAFQSADRGLTWSRIELKMPVSFTASALLRGATPTPVLANQAGTLFTLNAGQWQARPGVVPAPLTALLPLPDGAMLALGRAGAVRLSAAGARP
jgi:photosystem II stability/assembly factor-like uncharacterized protein